MKSTVLLSLLLMAAWLTLAPSSNSLAILPKAGQQDAKSTLKLRSDLFKAAQKGDAKKIKSLAAQGADINVYDIYYDIQDPITVRFIPGDKELPVPTAALVDATETGILKLDESSGVESTLNLKAGTTRLVFKYRFVTVRGTPPLYYAITSKSPLAVQVLLELGADAHAEFFVESADTGTGLISTGLAGIISSGTSLTISPVLRAENGLVTSLKMPAPARRGTCLSVAEKLLTKANNVKDQAAFQVIVDLLQRSAR